MHKTFYVVAAVLAVALSAKPSATSEPQSPLVFYNNHTNMCLQPINGSMATGAVIVEEPCNPNANATAQQWLLIAVGGGYHYKNVLSGLCLDARGKAQKKTPVQQWTCDKITNEVWEPMPYPPGPNAPKGPGVQLISRVSGSSGYCLDIPGGQAKSGLAMQIWSCNGTLSQGWMIEVVGSCVNNPINAGCEQRQLPPPAKQ
jgi:hypothetical protein